MPVLTKRLSLLLAGLVISVMGFTTVLVVSQERQDPRSFAAGTTYNAGYETFNGNFDSGNNNLITTSQVTTGSNSGTLQSVSVYIGNVTASPNNHMQVGVYSDNGSNAPGALVGSSSSVVLTPNSWNTVPVSSGAIAANTKYWLGFNLDGNTTQFGYTAGAGNSAWRHSTPFGTWPNPYGTPSQTSTSERYAIYMTYGDGSSVPTPTGVSGGNTHVSLSLFLHGLGKGGDSANPNAAGNTNPLRPQRTVSVDVYNQQNQLVTTKQGTVNFNSTIGNFTGTVDLGTDVTNGFYMVKVKTDQYLRMTVPGIQTLTVGQTIALPPTTLITGDINNDNAVNISDYNILIGCYSDLAPAVSCSAAQKLAADITDDGFVNQFDYNLFLRESTNIQGEPGGGTLPTATPTQSAPTATPTPTTGGGATTTCPLPKYPSPSCTGVPAGTTLTTHNGELEVTTPGVTIDKRHVTGAIVVKAENVTITNSQVDGGIYNENDAKFTVRDTTIGKATGCVISPGMGWSRYTAERVHIRGFDDGFRAGGADITIRDSYVKNCGSASSHGDGIQDYLKAERLVFEHNTMDLCGPWTTVPTSKNDCDVPGHNSPVFVHSSVAHGNGSTDVRIANNLALGGVYTFYLYPAYGTWEIEGNRVVNNTWDFGAYEMEGLCQNVDTWNDNRIVTIDANYNITSTVRTESCQ